MNVNIYSESESYARPDDQVKRYHSALITEVGEPGRSRLPQFVRAEDFELMAGKFEVADAGLRHAGEIIEKMTAERDQLQRDLDARDQEIDRLAKVERRFVWLTEGGGLKNTDISEGIGFEVWGHGSVSDWIDDAISKESKA